MAVSLAFIIIVTTAAAQDSNLSVGELGKAKIDLYLSERGGRRSVLMCGIPKIGITNLEPLGFRPVRDPALQLQALQKHGG